MDFEVRFTRLATAFAETKYGGLSATEQRVRSEVIASQVTMKSRFVVAIGMSDINLPPEQIELLICCYDPGESNIVTVDTGHFEETSTITSGRYKGKRLMVPVADSVESGIPDMQILHFLKSQSIE